MRLFVAINFDESTKNKVQEIIKELKKVSVQGKFISNEHMHLTLEFLGEIQTDKVVMIKDAMDQVASDIFSMELTRVGYFKRREGDIYWLGIEENKYLLKTQAILHEQLIKQGFELESRVYKPHLTIGRKVKMEESFNIDEFSKSIDKISTNIDKIDLMKSEQINGKLVHSIVYTKRL